MYIFPMYIHTHKSEKLYILGAFDFGENAKWHPVCCLQLREPFEWRVAVSNLDRAIVAADEIDVALAVAQILNAARALALSGSAHVRKDGIDLRVHISPIEERDLFRV